MKKPRPFQKADHRLNIPAKSICVPKASPRPKNVIGEFVDIDEAVFGKKKKVIKTKYD